MYIKVVPRVSFVSMLVLATATSIGLLLADVVMYRELIPGYLIWNLFLAWIPYALALWLNHMLRGKAWSSWEGIALSVAWLAFLPNSFYMISDFIHLAEPTQPDQLLFNTVLFTSFIYTGLLLGFGSLSLVHTQFSKRLKASSAMLVIAGVLLICSIAIYIGRDLRWNTWDILIDPAGVLFDLSTRLLHPAQYGPMLAVVVPFFVLLASMYIVVWYGTRLFRTCKE